MLRLDHWQPDPSRRQHDPEMPMREKYDPASHLLESNDPPVVAHCEIRWHLATGASVLKNRPLRPLAMDSSGPFAFVVAIVPVREVRFDLDLCAEPGQGAGALCALPWAGEDAVEREAGQSRGQGVRLVLALSGQGNVRPAGVLSG